MGTTGAASAGRAPEMLKKSETSNDTAYRAGATVTTAGSPPLDRDELVQRCLGNMQLVHRILRQVESSVATSLSEIDSAIQIADMPRLASTAHRLKGTAANVAAGPLRHLAWRMESLACNAADIDELRECYALLEIEQHRLIEVVADITSSSS